ncbi:MAG TPA: cobalt ABC transporter permease [Epulopiscium sp.]|nr:cobalt ABC transporter permease [Candidatus Epulonipiscium sp.]
MLREIAVYAKANKYAKVHPIEKLLLCILPIIIMGFVQTWGILIFNILCFMLMHLIAQTPYKRVFKMVTEIVMFYLMSSIVLVFDRGMYFSILMILRGISSALCLSLFIFTTPFDFLLHYLSKFESIRDLCDISKNVERFFMLLEDEGNQIVLAMKSRGGFRGIKGRVNDMIRVMILLFHNSMERWKITQEVLAARSYKGKHYYGEALYSSKKSRIIGIMVYNIIFTSLTLLLGKI